MPTAWHVAGREVGHGSTRECARWRDRYCGMTATVIPAVAAPSALNKLPLTALTVGHAAPVYAAGLPAAPDAVGSAFNVFAAPSGKMQTAVPAGEASRYWMIFTPLASFERTPIEIAFL